jgi:tetratricopeptide (TPR) repeat protein
MMSDLLDALIEDIENRVRSEDPTAIERAAKLAERYPDEPEVWHLLAYAHARKDDMDGAILAMTRMMDVAPSEPETFYSRGRYELRRGNLKAALADFNEGIALSEQLQYTYYLNSLYFFRAEVLVKLGRKAEARADLAHLRDDFVMWTTKLRSKADILAECEE